MAQVKRNDIDGSGHPSPEYAAAHQGRVVSGHDAGGPVAQLQADLALRIAGEGIGWAPPVPLPPAERWVRLASIAAGYTALFAGYAVAALFIAHVV